MGEAAYLGARAGNSVRGSWEHTEAFLRPDVLVEWCNKHFPPFAGMVYLGRAKHPQTSYKRSRIGGITTGQLVRGEADFKYAYGLKYGSRKAGIAFDVLLTGVQHNARFEPQATQVQQLRLHYEADAVSRTYALGAQKADAKLIASAIDANGLPFVD